MLKRSTIFLTFLRFGLLAWGGPVAQIAMIKRELVEKEGWVDPARFNRLLAVYQVLPGPEAHELCVHLGMLKGGRLGGFLAGLGFMLPGLVLILLLAWLYQYIALDQPLVAAMLTGIQIGVIAIIVRAVHRIAGHALGDRWLWLMALAAAAGTALGVSLWIILPTAGLAYAGLATGRHGLAGAILIASAAFGYWLSLDTGLLGGASPPRVQADALALFLSGLKAGLLTFGGAYTAIPFVRDDTVGRGWISDAQFLDGLALSGIIPAPLIIFATFVGYLAGGLAGALAMTAGIFLPAFAFGLLFHDRLERVIEDQRLHNFLAGVAAGVVGLIAVTAVQLGQATFGSAPNLIAAAIIFIAAVALLYLRKANSAVPMVIGASALAGLALF